MFNGKNLIDIVFLFQNTDISSYLLSMVAPGITDHLSRKGLVSLDYLCEKGLLGMKELS